MARKGENIYKRKDGRWEGRYIKSRSSTGKANYGYVYAKSYREVKANVKELLEGKETLVKGIKTKDRKSYNAVVKIGEKGYIDFISFSK